MYGNAHHRVSEVVRPGPGGTGFGIHNRVEQGDAMSRNVVTVFGGSGFIGRHLVRRLVATADVVRVCVRDPEAANFLKPMGDVAQIVPLAADVTDPESVARAVADADAVVNLVGILYERGRQTFRRVHVEGAAQVAEAARDAGARAFVHLSAIGADAQSSAEYARTKAAGEAAVREAFPDAVILRPSVVFGPEDRYFNLFAEMTRYSPGLPVLGCSLVPRVSFGEDERGIAIDVFGAGGPRVQPVYAGDVADAIVCALAETRHRGQAFELGGPEVYSFKEIMEIVLAETGRRRFLYPIPFGLARFYAWFLEKLPVPLLTRDQIELLRTDNVVGAGALTLTDLGLEATPVEGFVSRYLGRFRPWRLREHARV